MAGEEMRQHAVDFRRHRGFGPDFRQVSGEPAAAIEAGRYVWRLAGDAVDIIAKFGVDVFHLLVGALVEPQGAGPQCFASCIELGETFALVGNGNGGDAPGIDALG